MGRRRKRHEKETGCCQRLRQLLHQLLRQHLSTNILILLVLSFVLVLQLTLGKKYLDRNSHYVWPAPLDKADTPGGRLLTGRDYQPPGSSESVPTLGTWPLLYELGRDPGEAYSVARSHPERVRELRERLAKFEDDDEDDFV